MRIELEIVGKNNYKSNNNPGSDKIRRGGNWLEAICADDVNVLDEYVNAVYNNAATSFCSGKEV